MLEWEEEKEEEEEEEEVEEEIFQDDVLPSRERFILLLRDLVQGATRQRVNILLLALAHLVIF